MKIIIKYSGPVYGILGQQECYPSEIYKPSRFCVAEKAEDGVLVYNTFTREMLLMNENEYQNLFLVNRYGDCHNYRYLIKHWYLVREGTDETTLAQTVRRMQRRSEIRKWDGRFNYYTILTTMNCNARCPYCYENERKKRSMSADTANDVAAYIRKTALRNITLSWFGGEPLVNFKMIDLICRKTIENGIPFSSTIVSNGYLFDQIDMDTMLNVWKLRNVQITLDGTGERYNRIKDYVYPDADGFKKVMENIGLLLSGGVKIDVRMNLSKDNADDLESLIDILASKFSGSGFSAYVFPLFEGMGNPPLELTDEERETVLSHRIRLQDYLVSKGLSGVYDLKRENSSNCMADRCQSVVIMPEGSISICEHHSDDELIGDIYSDSYDADVINSWQEHNDVPECGECLFLPQCTMLKKCRPNVCTAETREYTDHRIRKAMLYEYERSKTGT